MKIKVSIKSKKDVSKWISICNLMAKSMCDHKIGERRKFCVKAE